MERTTSDTACDASRIWTTSVKESGMAHSGMKPRTTADGMKYVILPKTAVAAKIPASTPGNVCCTAMTSTLVGTLENSVARIAEPARRSGDRIVRPLRSLEARYVLKWNAPRKEADKIPKTIAPIAPQTERPRRTDKTPATSRSPEFRRKLAERSLNFSNP